MILVFVLMIETWPFQIILKQAMKGSMNSLSLLFPCLLVFLYGARGKKYLVRTVDKHQTRQQHYLAKDYNSEKYMQIITFIRL